jgi:hypothetical protein
MRSMQWDQVNAVLEQFAARVGLEECTLDERGSAQLAFDDVFVSLLLDEERGALLLLTNVGRPQASAEIYGWLLDANLFWSGGRGATLARDPAARSIILQRPLPVAGLEPEHLEAALENFVGAAEELRRRLAQAEGSQVPDRGEERLALQLMQHLLRA